MNVPYITYREMIGNPLESKMIEKTTNRAFWYFFEDMLAVRQYIKTNQLSLKNVIGTLFRPKAYAIWDWNDPKPFFSYWMMLLSKYFKRSSQR